MLNLQKHKNTTGLRQDFVHTRNNSMQNPEQIKREDSTIYLTLRVYMTSQDFHHIINMAVNAKIVKG